MCRVSKLSITVLEFCVVAGVILVLGVIFLKPLVLAEEEEITITTYYPSPHGVYKNLKTTEDTWLATDAGKVGIGTIDPEGKAHIMSYSQGAGHHDYTLVLQATELNGSVQNNSPGISYLDSQDIARGAVGLAGRLNAWSNDVDSGDMVLRATEGGDIILATSPSPTTSTNITPKIYIRNDGNVGIGEINPSVQLHITHPPQESGWNGLRVEQAGDTTPSGSGSYNTKANLNLFTTDPPYSAVLPYNNFAVGGVYFSGLNSSDTEMPYAVILGKIESDASGSEKGKLDFLIRDIPGAGGYKEVLSLRTTGVFTDGGNIKIADYVFSPDYKLESIEEHAEFMWKKRHLPAVPRSEKSQNGGNMIEIGGQINGVLEELEKAHIYIEQLNERIKALEAKLD